ncbi:hypothetical protein RV15_GL000641 [Enterococcus silesiacus]|uniref:Uncharacterized protein n=1 Tax=Enterococcus silesiacus TaxID=332949 RepID=A0AA91GAH0_9ENTE|nr:hypothetical protein RV15_GL000641 [Enterococcus silesiacus]
MENYPWQEKEFLHGVLSWAVLQHNTLDKIVELINCIHESLISDIHFCLSKEIVNCA